MTQAVTQHALMSHLLLQPELHGMLPVEGGKFTGLQQSATRWPEALKQAAALCTSLTLVSKSQVAGDLADKQAFKAVEARFLVSPKPPPLSSKSPEWDTFGLSKCCLPVRLSKPAMLAEHAF